MTTFLRESGMEGRRAKSDMVAEVGEEPLASSPDDILRSSAVGGGVEISAMMQLVSTWI